MLPVNTQATTASTSYNKKNVKYLLKDIKGMEKAKLLANPSQSMISKLSMMILGVKNILQIFKDFTKILQVS